MNTNTRESSEITSQVSIKLNHIKVDLNARIREAIELAVIDQVLPTIRNTVEGREMGPRTNMGQGSSERHRSPEVENMKITCGNTLRTNKNLVIKVVKIKKILETLISLMEFTTVKLPFKPKRVLISSFFSPRFSSGMCPTLTVTSLFSLFLFFRHATDLAR